MATREVEQATVYVECPECNGCGEIPEARDCFGNWDTTTCRVCGGDGEITRDEAAEIGVWEF